ncbi:FAD-binding oxidoreductase [Candidatus Protochlamydia phocaeensis]|uniref:FAD-binding oxidoreductase n=1 Tax=Candidatus Protochlamydia phocaeensis TaxID=1414722 RepID=UPI000837ED7A|nr:FAD-binding oxidoreductase [Candidatus Protochlamydia phocaeensis]
MNLKTSSNQSLYLLGDAGAISPVFKRYRRLMEAFADQGAFISLEENSEWLACYEQDSQPIHARLPLLAFRPASCSVISPFVKACAQAGIPLKVRCGGTSLNGSSVSAPEGILILTNHLKQILFYDKETGCVQAEPGVTPRQLNLAIEEDGWSFPLEIATGGVAGLAGCLSCSARNAYRGQRAISQSIRSATLIDGQGEQIEVPSPLICGAEGLFGIIIKMELLLTHKPAKRLHLICRIDWENLFAHFSRLRKYQALTGIIWQENAFKMIIEGDAWRVQQTAESLLNLFGSQIELEGGRPLPFSFPQSLPPAFIYLSSAMSSAHLPEGIEIFKRYAQDNELSCQLWSDVLSGVLYMSISSNEETYAFAKKLERLLVQWVDWLDRMQGGMISAYGIGKLMQPYLTPFWEEESLRFLKGLQRAFDPFELFVKDHVFPVAGKSLEKVLYGQME